MFAGGVDAISQNGVVGDPTRASAQHGSRYWEKVLEITLSVIGDA
jgi:creatinine amidohydrolase/Fe(II)-dependent formamide hydrolase-like protein